MSIETSFRFDQFVREPHSRAFAAKGDLLGTLRAFIGHHHVRKWSGHGFNLIWRPHDKSGTNNQDFFLELNMTTESLAFTDITGATGIANRGFSPQPDLALGGLGYQQEVSDTGVKPHKPLHFEPGVWLNVPNTGNPNEPNTVARLGSIPHGTTINSQGLGQAINGKPQFKAQSTVPFAIGSKDDGATGLVHFPEGDQPLATSFAARTPIGDAPGLTDVHFQNPIKILEDIANAQNITRFSVFTVTTDVATPDTDQAPNPGHPGEGGGVEDIAFLVGAGGVTNANVPRMTSTFWVEEVLGTDGKTFLQLQYVQRVLLNFNTLSWPHISVATLLVQSEED